MLRLYYASLRIRMDPDEERVLRDVSRPVVGLIWHNRSFIVPMVFRLTRQPEKCLCLVSPSKAAAWEEALFRALGVPSARGSSSRRSIQAVRELIHANAAGQDIYISPDGPSGPRYVFKRGAIAAARITKAPMLLIGVECQAAWRPKTWDRHLFPMPFSKVVLRAKRLENEEIFDGKRDDGAACAELGKILESINADHGL